MNAFYHPGYTKDVRKMVQAHLNTFEAWREANAA
jgi:hypothetical protein